MGNDKLTIVGAGIGSTVLTSVGNENIYLMSAGSGGREITVEDLTLQVPGTFPDGQGAAVQLSLNDTLRDVEIVSLNPESNAVTAAKGGNLAIRVKVRGAGPGSIRDGFAASSENADLTVEDSVLEGAGWGLISSAKGANLTARRVTEIGTRTYGAIVTAGRVKLENTRIVTAAARAFYVSAAANESRLEADHVTALNVGGGTAPAMEIRRLSSGPGEMTMLVSNSILRDFYNGYKVENMAGPGIGTASLSVSYSNFQKSGTSSNGLFLGVENIDADAQLEPDFSLKPTSPSIDKGDPAFGLNTDFLGAPRPNDGDGDGVAVQDQGAFEYQRPALPKEEGGGGGGTGGSGGSGGSGPDVVVPPRDTVAPLTKLLAGPGKGLAQGKAKFRFTSSEAGSRFECKLDKGKVRACSSPKLYRGLKPGRHSFKVWAIDAAGNRAAAPAKRRFRVPRLVRRVREVPAHRPRHALAPGRVDPAEQPLGLAAVEQ